MKCKFKQYSIIKKVSILTLMLTFACFILTTPCFSFNLMEIPLGILLGGLGSALSFSLFLIKEDGSNKKAVMRLTIFLIIIMFFIHCLTIIISGVVYYVYDLHIFNIFSTFFASFFGLICFIILALIEKKGEK